MTAISQKSLLRYALWGEIANLFRIFSELLLMSIWLIALTFVSISWIKTFLILGSIYTISHFLARGLHQIKCKTSLQQVFFAVWITIAIVISTRLLLFSLINSTFSEFVKQIFLEDVSIDTIQGFWILLFTLLAVVRGINSARRPATASSMSGDLKLGLVLFSVFAILFANQHLACFLPSFFTFILMNLAGMSLARIADLSDSYGGKLPGFNLQWAAGIGLTSLLVVFIGRIVSWLIDLKAAEFLGKGLVLLLQLFISAIVLIASPVMLAIVALLELILSLLTPNLNNLLDESQLNAGDQLLDDLQTEITEATHVDPIIFVMIGVLLLIVIVAVILLRNKPWERTLTAEDGNSDIQVNKRLSNPLKDLFSNQAARKKRSSASSLFAAARVRYVYKQLMDLCEKLGKPRPRSLTPNEFLPRMFTLYPLHQSDLETITDAYVRVRYGELPETSKEIEDVLDAWQRINTYAKEILDERKKQLKRASTYRAHR